MITEIAILNIKDGASQSFEASFNKAKQIICSMPGYIQHELLKCVEHNNRYVLIIGCEKLEDHTIGFRQSEPYQE